MLILRFIRLAALQEQYLRMLILRYEWKKIKKSWFSRHLIQVKGGVILHMLENQNNRERGLQGIAWKWGYYTVKQMKGKYDENENNESKDAFSGS